jgi:hypothetical protein
MDFYQIKERVTKTGLEVYPDFMVRRSQDLMVRGKSFYAIWDEEAGLWSTDEYDVQRLVDADLKTYADELERKRGESVHVRYMGSFNSKTWTDFHNYINHLSDSSVQLDTQLTFTNSDVKKGDHVSRRLPYTLESGDISAYDELIGTLYAPSEREKLEWAVGAIVAGDGRSIQKFLVLYGEAGTGKSTWLNLVQQLFEGYYTTFEAKALTGSNNAFSTEAFRANPLVAIQHDGDLSRIEDNTKLNSIISHELMTMNEKYKPSYSARINAFLFMGTNKPVRITDSKSGIIRRLIDVHPSGNRVTPNRYASLVAQIQFELGAIAHHCLGVYRGLGKNYYSNYRPIEMMVQTDTFYNFMLQYYDIFRHYDGTSLGQAYTLYKQYCEESQLDFKMPRHRFSAELRNYFDGFKDRARIEDAEVRSWFYGFRKDKFRSDESVAEAPIVIAMDDYESIFDTVCADQPAQYASESETPLKKWSEVTTTLKDLDTTKLHYVKPGLQHIVIDFDLRDDQGNKSLELNLAAASAWPKTYSEYSKSGSGVHLHYFYEGDVNLLSRVFAEGIEIKVFNGDSSLRRKLTKCNNIPIGRINGSLPQKERRVLDTDSIKSEKALRTLILRNLAKEIHPGTKPSIQFIHKILEDAYTSDLVYDVSDMRAKIIVFANNSSNNAMYCLKMVKDMKFASENQEQTPPEPSDERLVFFDCEVFPNFFGVCWKYEGDANVVRMINPPPAAVEQLVTMKLVGFNNRRYDNHILYARIMGFSIEQLYALSQRITSHAPNAMFGEAYNISHADIYDYSSVKQSLKRFQVDLQLNHKELGLPWDQPVPEDRWEEVMDYCANDVITTEQVHESRKQDYVARQILAELSGLSVNDTTQKHTAKIIFGSDKRPQEKFKYTDLSTTFPGYKFDFGKSTYKGEEVGEGGYVYAEPGMYTDVAVLDVSSMHPTSLILLDAFGPYTPRFAELRSARLAIKAGDYASARTMLEGKLGPYLTDEGDAKALSYALKIVINIVYGLTSASFENPFRDPRNKDNIVAKRGALFMIDLKEYVQGLGFQVIHIKTDSVKIPNATPEIITLVEEFGKLYGYEFEHEVTYEKMCLVNDAVYIAKTVDGEWTATGAQFARPYVFKTLFSHEPLEFWDYVETKTVTTALYLGDPDADPHFVGRAGAFIPVKEGTGGSQLLREKDGKYYSAGGAKGYFWREAHVVDTLGLAGDIDLGYFNRLVDEAVTNISKFGDIEWFTG